MIGMTGRADWLHNCLHQAIVVQTGCTDSCVCVDAWQVLGRLVSFIL